MAQKINQKEYLKKYFGGHRKKPKKSHRLNSKFNDETEESLDFTGEDAPQIVDIIDERVNSGITQVRCGDKWKSISKSQSEVQELSNPSSNNKLDKYQNISIGLTRTSKQKNKKSSVADLSPPRKNVHQSRNNMPNLGSNDLSPPRKAVHSNNEGKSNVDKYFKKGSQVTDISKAETYIEPVVHESTNKYSGNNENSLNKEIALEKTRSLYRQWGKGIRQVENDKEKNGYFSYESGKPLARYSNDKDLDSFLKEQDRHGDPMLTYINKKNTRNTIATEVYKGFIPENRFNIRPGYRWDGVNRSNGYEQKYFDQQSKRKVDLNDAYTFGSEDL